MSEIMERKFLWLVFNLKVLRCEDPNSPISSEMIETLKECCQEYHENAEWID